LKDGTPVTIRPIRPNDEPMMVKFHDTLSPESVHFRYFGMLQLSQRVEHKRLSHVCSDDYDEDLALVAEHAPAASPRHEIVGVARLAKGAGEREAEFAIVVSDGWQGRGLGTHLLELLVAIARQEKLRRIFAHILADNTVMQHLFRKAGFALVHDSSAGEITAELALARRGTAE
jgi:acetyltransferase